MENVIIIGSGADNDRLEIIKAKLEKIGHEVIIVNSKEEAFNLRGAIITNEDLVKAFESVPKENKPLPLSEILKEDPKPFVLQNYHKHNLEPCIHEENHGPIGAILGNKKRRRK